MKKLLALFVVAGMVAFVACGPSAKEKAEKAKADSTKKADSIAAEQKKADSLQAIIEKQKQDSIAKADSLKKKDEKKGDKKEVKKPVKK